MAQVFATWHGGYSYSPPSIPEHVETFASLEAARDAFQARYWNRDGSTPCVDESASMALYLADPSDSADPYPDALLTIGPRGGIRRERC